MRFKIGDRVKVKSGDLWSYNYLEYVGEEGVIEEIDYDDYIIPCKVYLDRLGCSDWFGENELIYIKRKEVENV